MKFKNSKGKLVNLNVQNYLVEWDKKERSIIQFKIKKFFQTYWKNHVVCSELPLVSTRMTFDLCNISQRVFVEIQGKQHDNYNKFFHNESRANFVAQIKRDMQKVNYCEMNNIVLIEIREDEVDSVTKEWVEERYGIVL